MTPTKTALEALSRIEHSQAMDYIKTQDISDIAAALTENTTDVSVDEVIDLLAIMWEGYENGDPCYENLDGEQGGFMGNAFQICDDKETRICEILNKYRPVKSKPEQPPC